MVIRKLKAERKSCIIGASDKGVPAVIILTVAAAALLTPPHMPAGSAQVSDPTFLIEGVATSISAARLDGETNCGMTDECRQKYVRYRNAIENAYKAANGPNRGVLKWLIIHFTSEGRTDWVKVSEEYGPWFNYHEKQYFIGKNRNQPHKNSISTTCRTYHGRYYSSSACESSEN